MNFGRYFLALSILCSCYFLHGCGSGTPDTTVNISNSQNQTNDQNQVQNESELDCKRDCKIDPVTGVITAPEDCKGGASAVLVVLTDDSQCQSVTELAVATQPQEEGE